MPDIRARQIDKASLENILGLLESDVAKEYLIESAVRKGISEAPEHFQTAFQYYIREGLIDSASHLLKYLSSVGRDSEAKTLYGDGVMRLGHSGETKKLLSFAESMNDRNAAVEACILLASSIPRTKDARAEIRGYLVKALQLCGGTADQTHLSDPSRTGLYSKVITAMEENRVYDLAAFTCEKIGQIKRAMRNYENSLDFGKAKEMAFKLKNPRLASGYDGAEDLASDNPRRDRF